MFELKTVAMGNGAVVYLKKVEGRPAETKTTVEKGMTVNIHNVAIPDIPAHYDVSFQIVATSQHQDIEATNYLTVIQPVTEESDQASYRLVEDRAARDLAPLLRAIADKLEANLPTFD